MKNIFICAEDEQKSYGFGKQWQNLHFLGGLTL